MDEITELLKELTEAHGVPGYETQFRMLLRINSDLLTISQDNIVVSSAVKQEPARPRIMLAGHMDEIGFMVKHITKEVLLVFTPGGWFDQVCSANASL